MRVRDHIAFSTTTALILNPWLRGRSLGLWAGGVLIDADHYLWFTIRHRNPSPIAAVKLFNGHDGPQHRATRTLHSPAALLWVCLLGVWRPQLRPVAFGMGLHVALDARHERLMGRARVTALQRDGFACRQCGAQGSGLVTHLSRQPWLLPSYRTANLVTLCGPCHERAHQPPAAGRVWS